MSWTQEEVDTILLEAQKRATTDKPFRELLLASPEQAIEGLSGKSVPAGFKIKVVESDPNYHLTFALPRYIGDELTANDMARVAGGLSTCLEGCVAYTGIEGTTPYQR